MWSLRSIRKVPFQPLRQAIQPRKQHPFRDVGLIEFVAHFPLQRGGDDDAAIHGFASFEQIFQLQIGR